jgi:alkyl sulfatase BDS1-like metallo-beta-lactamase superfamily hydrolase
MRLSLSILILFVSFSSLFGESLQEFCEKLYGKPRVIPVTEGVYVAVGYDLANTILIQTPEGNLIVDPGMLPSRSREARRDLLGLAPGKVRWVVYTHSHIDHVGAAGVWVTEGVEVIATDRFLTEFFKQYGVFSPAESRRGRRQFGGHLPLDRLPCPTIGKRISWEDLEKEAVSFRLPTRTFSRSLTLDAGGMKILLFSAEGETKDHLFLYIPEKRVLLPGDLYYSAFPNLYTIRGTSERPVDGWIRSLDAMRSYLPSYLIPSHTLPVTGEREVYQVLTDYRDAIQWLRDEVAQRANRGDPLHKIVEEIRLPSHLADLPYLRPWYGDLSWSVRGIYSYALGWFDEDPEDLYPLPETEFAIRMIEKMGGVEKVLGELEKEDLRWQLYITGKLLSCPLTESQKEKVLNIRRSALIQLGELVENPLGKAYLWEYAWELEHGTPPSSFKNRLDERGWEEIPVDILVSYMVHRFRKEDYLDREEYYRLTFTDTGQIFHFLVRRGILEIQQGDLPPYPPPFVGELVTDTNTFRRLIREEISPFFTWLKGKIRIRGEIFKVRAFFNSFER